MTDWIGITLSKVTIERQIGRGGMAEVFVGTHTTLNRRVAVKVLHDHLTDEPEAQARFRDEAQAVANLRHPNIVQIYDFDVYQGRPYIIMELLEGPPLSSYLNALRALGSVLRPSMAAELITGMASALDYAHNLGIIHRDIKPANVVLTDPTGSTVQAGSPLTDDTQPILTDFGIAHIATSATQTVSGAIMGTPAYMSPEQVQGEKIDQRSDIYSLGIVAYEILAGSPPFNGDSNTPASVMYKQVHDVPPRIDDLPEITQVVLDRALAKEPEMRYSSAGEFAADLTAATKTGHLPSAVTLEPTFSRSDSTQNGDSDPGPRQSSNRRLWYGVVTAAGLLLAGSILVALFADTLLPTLRDEDASIDALQTTVTEIAPTAGEPTKESELATEASQVLPSNLNSNPRGFVRVRDDGATIQINDLPQALSGFEYVIWKQTDTRPERLGRANEAETSFALEIDNSIENDFFQNLEQIILSLEPKSNSDDVILGEIILVGSPDSVFLDLWATLDAVSNGPAGVAPLLLGLEAQVLHFDNHLGFAVDAARNEDYPGARRHSEHVVNISEGSSSSAYADWNADGRIENPGDAFGLVNYLDLLLLTTNQTLLGSAPGEGDPRALGLSRDTENVLRNTRAASTLGQRISATDTIIEAQPLAEDLAQLKLLDIVNGLIQQANDAELAYHIELKSDR